MPAVVNVRKVSRLNRKAAKRGDTIIEVMFAIAVFSLVAVLSIAMMNAGVSDAQGALELVVARNELNAQAEAIRFIHSSYISELTLPLCSDEMDEGEKCQQYAEIWEDIKNSAIEPPDEGTEADGLLNLSEFINNYDTKFSNLPLGCDRVYSTNNGESILHKNKAFILNTRNLNGGAIGISGYNNNSQDIPSFIQQNDDDEKLFHAAELNARVLYEKADLSNSGNSSDAFLESNNDENIYDKVQSAEGIWVIAVKSKDESANQPVFYDFYIQSCWYSPGASNPTVLDTVIRLYNSGV